ncbi:MAG TPA: hypothetical protein V7792_00345 [Candidatus Azoamicus sp. OHIO2]
MLKIKIKFFGILKDYFDDIDLNIEPNSTLLSLKEHIINKHLDNTSYYLKQTIYKSIFSNNDKFLDDSENIKENCTIYLLPPFSGG